MNIASIVDDALKLVSVPGRGVVCFALFPVPTGSDLWVTYLDRIAGKLGAPLSETKHCTRARVDLGDGNACEVAVCSFQYPPAERTLV